MMSLACATRPTLCTLGRTVQPGPRRDRYAGRMIPLIGISTYVADVAWASWERRAAVLPESYFELVAAAGGRPMLLPPPAPPPTGPGGAAEVVAVLDGLVLTGGGDVDPPPTARSRTPRWAASTRPATPASGPSWPPRSRPTCRCWPSAGAARSSTSSWAARCTSTCPTWSGTTTTAAPPWSSARSTWPRARHAGTAGVFGRPHGAVLAPPVHPRPGPRLVPRPAGDGVVEAVELPGARFVLGVQWHPEEGMDQRPFDALVEAAREYRGTGTVCTADLGLASRPERRARPVRCLPCQRAVRAKCSSRWPPPSAFSERWPASGGSPSSPAARPSQKSDRRTEQL
jgi:putative glutamine amidotransferase